MRRFRCWPAIAVTLMCVSRQAAPENLIANPSFEEPEELEVGEAVGWGLRWNSGGDWEAALDDAEAAEGDRSLRFEAPEGGVRFPRVCQAVEVRPNTDHGFACSMKVETGSVRVWISEQGWGGDLANIAAPADGQWHRVEARFNTGQATTINVMFAVMNPERQAARLWIDDVRLIAATAGAAEQRLNLARGAGYEVLTRRSYGRTAASDLTILTDGEWGGGYWTRDNTLCWRAQPGESADVMVDLGAVRAISGFSVAAVRGVAAHPPAVTARVSDDMTSFREAVTWDCGAGLEVRPTALSTELSSSPQVRVAGRWVLFSMSRPGDERTGAPRSGLVCVTELQVHPGDFDPAGAERGGDTIDLEEYIASRDPLRFLPSISTEVETPHIDWAPKPAGGRPDVLTLVQYVCGRDPVELEQRVGMDQRIFHLLRQSPRMDLFRTRELLAELATPPEVLLLAGIDWGIVRKEAQERIGALVREGMGLVWVHPAGESGEMAELMAGLPAGAFEVLDTAMDAIGYPLLDDLRDGALGELRAGTVGEGRVAVWRYDNADGRRFVEMNSALWPQCAPGTNEPEDFAYWEIYAAHLAKMVLWAAHGEPAAALAPIEVTGADRGGIALRVAAAGEATDGLHVRVCLTDEHRRELGEMAVALDGPTELAFSGPLQTGVHAAIVWLEDTVGRQLDWRVAPAEIAGPSIAGVTLDAERYERGDVVGITVACEGVEALGRATVRAELVDFYGGVAAVAEGDAAPEVTLELATDLSRSLVVMLHVRLLDGDALVDERFLPVPTIDEPDLREYTVGLWSSYGSYIGKRHWGYEMLRSQLPLMVDIAVAGPLPGYPRYDMRPCPENMHRIYFKLAEVYERMNLAEPGFREQFLATIRPKVEGAYNWGAYDFSVGDECGYTLRRDEHTLAAFRRWLRGEYGDIARLNAAWNATFASFDEVGFDPEAADPAIISFAPGLDERLFGDWLFADTLMAARELVEEIDARNRLGISGTRDPAHYIGFDWWQLMTTLTHLGCYDGLQRECIRSWRKPGDMVTSFVGYDSADGNEVAARYFPWLELFSGLQGVSIYSASSGDLGGFVRPDLTLTNRARWLIEEVEELKAGIGMALLTAERAPAPIAVHHSQRSIHLANLLGRPALATLTSTAEIIKDLGLQFDFVSHEQLETGVLAQRGYRVFILPDSVALSDAEVAALDEFAQAGGLVLSFGDSGAFDEHGRRRETSALDGLATVCEEPPADYREFQPSGVAGETVERLSANEEVSAAWQARFEGLLEGAGVEPAAVVRSADGSPKRYVEVVEFERGPIRYLGVLPRYFGGRYSRGTEPLAIDASSFEPATIQLAEGGHVYDVRAATYLGETRTIATRLATGVAQLYAVLPYRVTGVAVECPETVATGGWLAVRGRVEVAGRAAGDHVLHVELADPAGEVIRPYRRNVPAEGGVGEVEFALGLNAMEGEWTVTVRDVVSGMTAERTVAVRDG